MRIEGGHKKWFTACLEMAPSLQYRPEVKHEDGYGSLDTRRAELYAKWKWGKR